MKIEDKVKSYINFSTTYGSRTGQGGQIGKIAGAAIGATSAILRKSPIMIPVAAGLGALGGRYATGKFTGWVTDKILNKRIFNAYADKYYIIDDTHEKHEYFTCEGDEKGYADKDTANKSKDNLPSSIKLTVVSGSTLKSKYPDWVKLIQE